MEKKISSNNYDITHQIEERRLFSIKEIAKMLDCSLLEIRNIINYYHIKFEKMVSGNGVKYAVYSYQAFMRIKVYHESRMEKARGKLTVLCQKMVKEEAAALDQHPLVTDKRCLDMDYWPDTIPLVFMEDEQGW